MSLAHSLGDEPMRKSPLGITTISGQSGQSRNVDPALGSASPCAAPPCPAERKIKATNKIIVPRLGGSISAKAILSWLWKADAKRERVAEHVRALARAAGARARARTPQCGRWNDAS